MEQRQYQIDQIEQVIELVSTKRKIVVQLPTGGGKTVEFAYITQRYIRNAGKSVLILVHRKELMYQAQKTIKEVLDIDAALITSTTSHFRIARVYIGMVESLISRLHMLQNVGLVIVDEAHIANFNKIHNIYLEELIIGFTATNISSNKREPMNKYYSDIVVGPQIKDLISDGYLAQNVTRCPKDIVDVTKFGIDKLKGDYNERQMATEYKLPRHVSNVVTNYSKYCYGKKTLIFNVTIDHSHEVDDCMRACGFPCRHLASDNDHERDEILKWFHDTEDAILCNVMIATVGFDEPTVHNIITNFSTLSLPKAIQCWGRGSRIIDQYFIDKWQHTYPYQLELKDHFQIIDMGGNCVKFGDWNDERDWNRMFHHPQQVYDGNAPVKTCPNCDGLVHAATRVCTLTNENGELCLHEFVAKARMQETDSELLVITKGIDLNKPNKKYEYYPMDEMAEGIVANLFKGDWNPNENKVQKHFRIYYDLCIKWYNQTMAHKEGNISDISHSGFHIRKAKNNFNSKLQKYNRNTPKIDEIKKIEVDENVPLLSWNSYTPKPEDNVYEW